MDELIKNWINEINLNDWSQLKKDSKFSKLRMLNL